LIERCFTALTEKRSTATGAITFQEKIKEIRLQAKVAGTVQKESSLCKQ
jgi:hypothetical protein